MTSHRTLHVLLAIGGTLATVAAVHPATAQQPTHITGSPALMARAKINGDSASKIALAKVPHGTIRSGELEEEKGALVYSFDLAVAGRSGMDEVTVNALDGAVVSHTHESAKAEQREAREEAREHATATPATTMHEPADTTRSATPRTP